MKWWQTALQLLKDVVATGIGVWLIIAQGLRSDPSTSALTAGLILLTPAGLSHLAMLLLSGPSGPERGHSESSPSLPAPSSLPSSPPAGGTSEGS